jgi:D-hexose-6-phosphate mutarotase
MQDRLLCTQEQEQHHLTWRAHIVGAPTSVKLHTAEDHAFESNIVASAQLARYFNAHDVQGLNVTYYGDQQNDQWHARVVADTCPVSTSIVL